MDEMYGDWLRDCKRRGALSDLHVAYASKTASPRDEFVSQGFVSDVVEANSKQIWSTLSAGGNVYLCGGAAGFGQSVGNCMKKIFSKEAGMTQSQASDHLSELLRKERYLEDLAD